MRRAKFQSLLMKNKNITNFQCHRVSASLLQQASRFSRMSIKTLHNIEEANSFSKTFRKTTSGSSDEGSETTRGVGWGWGGETQLIK